MVSERDIYATAFVLIRQHGEDATAWAVRRVDQLSDAGDEEGARTFRRVIEAIEVLQRTEPETVQ